MHKSNELQLAAAQFWKRFTVTAYEEMWRNTGEWNQAIICTFRLITQDEKITTKTE